MDRWMSHPAVWALAPFAGAVVDLVLESLETAIGERVARDSGDAEATEMST